MDENGIEKYIDVYCKPKPDFGMVEYVVTMGAKCCVAEETAAAIPDEIIANALVGTLREEINSRKTGVVIKRHVQHVKPW